MQDHLMSVHSLPINSAHVASLEKYACIYCQKNIHDIDSVKKHLVFSHPDQQPYVCERVLVMGMKVIDFT